MLEWLAENIGTILITAGLIVIVALIIRSIVRDKKAGISSCGAKCGGCGACAHGRKMPRRLGLRRQRPQGC